MSLLKEGFVFVKQCVLRWHITARTSYNRHRHKSKYPKRDELLHVNPRKIDYLITPNFRQQLDEDATHLLGGDWDIREINKEIMLSSWREHAGDRIVVPVENYGLLKSARAHFTEGRPWEETEIYTWLVNNTELWEGSRYESQKRIDESLRQFDELYKSIEERGYLSQRESYKKSEQKQLESESTPELEEVVVNIGRDGRLIFEDGRHRFTAAYVLGVEEIPVRVLVRHQKWQKIREEVNDVDSIEKLSTKARRARGHPDLKSIRINSSME